MQTEFVWQHPMQVSPASGGTLASGEPESGGGGPVSGEPESTPHVNGVQSQPHDEVPHDNAQLGHIGEEAHCEQFTTQQGTLHIPLSWGPSRPPSKPPSGLPTIKEGATS